MLTLIIFGHLLSVLLYSLSAVPPSSVISDLPLLLSLLSAVIIIPGFSCMPGLSYALRPEKTNHSVCYHQLNAHKQLKNPQCYSTYRTPWHSIWDRLDLPTFFSSFITISFSLYAFILQLNCITCYLFSKFAILLFLFHATASEIPLAGLESPAAIFLKLRPYPLFNPTLNSCSFICCMKWTNFTDNFLISFLIPSFICLWNNFWIPTVCHILLLASFWSKNSSCPRFSS